LSASRTVPTEERRVLIQRSAVVPRPMRLVVILSLLAVLGACDEKKPEESTISVVEAIGLSGICWENHVADTPDNKTAYEGSIAYMRDAKDGAEWYYGSVRRSDAFDPKKIMEKVQHPNRYFPADSIDFLQRSGIDMSADHLLLQGTSDRGTPEQRADDPTVHGYTSTCDVSVVKRGKTYAEVDPWHARMTQQSSEQ